MVTTKKRLTSLLLVVCMTIALCAGFIIAAPVTVKADVTGISNVDMNYNGNSIRIEFTGSGYKREIAILTITDNTTGAQYIHSAVATPYSDTNYYRITHTSFVAPVFGVFIYDPNGTYTLSFPREFICNTVGDPLFPNGITWTTPSPAPSDPSLGSNNQAPDFASSEYEERHFDFWMAHYYAMYGLADGGRYTVDTYGQSIDHIRHFILDIVCDKGLTLTVKHNGNTYVLTRSNIREAMRGNNHLFESLGRYKR